MNLYLRYFDDETVVSSVTDAVSFLKSLKMDDFDINDDFIASLNEFVESPVSYPKRYKVRAHYYFIVIKTNAATLEEFKRNNMKSMLETDDQQGASVSSKKYTKDTLLGQSSKGWYDGQLNFKRVICVPSTGKFQYKDTIFRALVKADSAVNCYERIVDYLKGRPDVDHRSQYPSPRGKNFQCTFVGEKRPVKIEG